MIKLLCQLLLVSLFTTSAYAAEVGNISQPESISMEQRIKTMNFVFAGFGPGNLSGIGPSGFAYHLQAGGWREAHPNAAIRILSDLDFQPSFQAWKWSGSVGAVWLVSRGIASPFMGVDFGYGFADGTTPLKGFSLGGSLGLQLFRTATTQLSLEGRSTVVLNSDHTPWANSLALSVLF